MNKLLSAFFALAIVLLVFSCSPEMVNIEIANEVFVKKIVVAEKEASGILVNYYNKSGEEITNLKNSTYFEFVLNGKLIASNHKLWTFENKTTRPMGNGGTEYILTFNGVKSPVKGLRIVLYQQVFPNSTLVREKLELKSDESSFTLNKLNNKLHFKFPVYSVQNTNENQLISTEIRIASFEKKPITFGDRARGNHMYYPDVVSNKVTRDENSAKGPVLINSNGIISWFTAYEHASQDDLNGMFDKQKLGAGNLINDAMQGTKGIFNFPILEEDFKFLGITTKVKDGAINVSVDVLRGGYLDGEIIDKQHPYSSVWTATGFYTGSELEDGKAMLRNYLFNQICEKPASRVPEFYYNTWGMQRNDKTKPLRGILTYNRIFEEIEYAAQLGVDIFVLDDGWQETQGIWYPNKERLPQGLAPIKKKLDEHGIKLGLWYSPMGIDSTTLRYKEHPEWIINDSEGNPILAQWDHPAFDFVSDFFDLFVEDCKNMVDQGCRFMKWDAINTFYSSLPNLQHGSDQYSEQELRSRYEYLLPIYVVRAMEMLTDYEPELVIEVDLTEARRVMVGLAPLSQGKLFWMNNGASWYNDYTTFRTKSMRTIANEFAGIVPLELFTYANYPHNISGNMKYNVHNSLLAGHGFWGNLALMTHDERKWVGEQVEQAKKVLPFLVDINPEVAGKVGDSPEVYSIVNSNESAGQVIIFSEDPVELEIDTEITPEKMLLALNTPYSLKENVLQTRIQMNEKESSVAILILPNHDAGITVLSSTSNLVQAKAQPKYLEFMVAEPGEQVINWHKMNGKPTPGNASNFDFEIIEKENIFEIKVKTKVKNTVVSLRS